LQETNYKREIEKLNILFVIDALSFGGGERVFAHVINGLDPLKYEIFLASQPNGHFYKAIRNRQVQFIEIDFSKRINPSLIFKLAEIINKNEIRVVHGQGARAEFYARLASKLSGKSWYVSATAAPVRGFNISGTRKRIYQLLDDFSGRFVARFIAVSEAQKEKMIKERHIPAEKVIKIYNGIEMEGYLCDRDAGLKIRREFGLKEDDILIGAIGRLVWEKGFEYLIQSIPDVLKVHSNVKFLIVGEGSLKEGLKAQGAGFKVNDHLVFTGFRNDIKEILSAIDILVIPSILEGFPMITLEGMAMAKPIIASSIDGITEQITDGETGLLVPSRDANALANAINRLINELDLALRLGMNARQRAEKDFSLIKMITETEKVYQSLYNGEAG
jgi:glycosyltransferase involved in cell wall biosynthesis